MRLKPDIHAFAHWLADPARAARPADAAKLGALRACVRQAWADIRGILDGYQRSYRALVFGGDPDSFVAFLRRCRQGYWTMGDLLGRFEQAVHAWRLQTAAFARTPLPPDLLSEFLDFLTRTFLAGDDGPVAAVA